KLPSVHGNTPFAQSQSVGGKKTYGICWNSHASDGLSQMGFEADETTRNVQIKAANGAEIAIGDNLAGEMAPAILRRVIEGGTDSVGTNEYGHLIAWCVAARIAAKRSNLRDDESPGCNLAFPKV